MAEFRQHWLINSVGERYDFTDQNGVKAFLDNPAGFGFSRTISTTKVGNSEIVNSQEFTMTDLTGDLVFFDSDNGSKYEEYQNFINFARFKPLEFHYLTPNDLSGYHCDVIFTSASKSDVSETDGLLRVPVTFHRLTEWLTDDDTVLELTNDPIDGGKYHDLIYDYHYAGTNLQGAKLYNNGTDEVGFVFEVFGVVQNMQFSLSANGERYGVCKINGTYDYVMINSVEQAEGIYLEYNGSSVANPEQYQDFTIADGKSYLTWTKLKVGESVISFTCGNIDTFNGYVRVSFKTSYATV